MKKVKEYIESIREQFKVVSWKPDGIIYEAHRIKDGARFHIGEELALQEIIVREVSRQVYVSQRITCFTQDYIHVDVNFRTVFLYNQQKIHLMNIFIL